MIDNLRKWLQGKKGYFIIIGTIISATIAFAAGEMTFVTWIATMLGSIFGTTLVAKINRAIQTFNETKKIVVDYRQAVIGANADNITLLRRMETTMDNLNSKATDIKKCIEAKNQ